MLYSSQAGKGTFHALNMKLERRFSSGFSVLGAYTWSHSIDTDSGGSFGSPNLNPANFQLDAGESAARHQRHCLQRAHLRVVR
jgi:hypothetical protein